MQVIVSYTLNLRGAARNWSTKELADYLNMAEFMAVVDDNKFVISTESWDIVED